MKALMKSASMVEIIKIRIVDHWKLGKLASAFVPSLLWDWSFRMALLMSHATTRNVRADVSRPFRALRRYFIFSISDRRNSDSHIMNQTMAMQRTRLMLGPWFRND